ncbi:MAG: hypothetical protein H6703_10275 [Myxococcales bacterium]|nr:hypothetical protein [Myxococcales bacterium]
MKRPALALCLALAATGCQRSEAPADGHSSEATAAGTAAGTNADGKPADGKPADGKTADGNAAGMNADGKATGTNANATPAAAAAPTAGLPAADRVFLAPLDGKNNHLLGADANALWAARLTAPDRAEIIWRITGPGVAQKLTYGDLGDGPRLYVAWGVGRGHLDAPLVVQAIDPLTGKATELWRGHGERNEAAHLAIADVDRDGAPELDFVRYVSKYMVAPQSIERDGTTKTGEAIRMASSWLRAEMDGDRGDETIIGRIYGDDRGLPGDLRIVTAKTTHMVPTDNGVKSLLYGTIGGEASALYFADGWVADYGKAAKAQLKRVRIVDGKPEVEVIGHDPVDYTFFNLTAVDLDGDRLEEIVAQGGKRVVLFSLIDEKWQMRPLTDLEPVLNTAVGRAPTGQTMLYIPARPATKAITLQ